MKTTKTTSADVATDLEAVLEHAFAGTQVEPDLARRVRERSEQVQELLRKKHGELNVAVELIREIRDEE